MKIETNKQIIKLGFSFLSIFIFMLFSFSLLNANRFGQEIPPTFKGVIAYIERDGDIYLHIGNTNQIIQLTFDANEHYYSTPKFSPNGQFLGFLKSDNQKGETTYDLHILDLETKQTKKLVENVDDWGGYDWAPDSKSIAFGYSIKKT